MRVTIDHQPLAGITPPMLLWWFRHIGDDVDHAGERMSGYLAWHPLDHIAWELARPAPGGGADEGASYRIVEAFGRDERFRVLDRGDALDLVDVVGAEAAVGDLDRPSLDHDVDEPGPAVLGE